MKYFKKLFFTLLAITIIFSMGACKPDLLELDIYTSDISMVSEGEVVDIHLNANFSTLGSDNDGDIQKAIPVIKSYLGDESKVEELNRENYSGLIVSTKIPMGTRDALQKANFDYQPLIMLVAEKYEGPNGENLKVTVEETEQIASLNTELKAIERMLSFQLPARNSVFRIVGDERDAPTVSAVSVFEKEKPYMIFQSEVKRKESIEIEFSGEDGSIYQILPAQMIFSYPAKIVAANR